MAPGKYYEFDRQEMRASLPDNYSKVLEVGCGAGNFVRTLEKEVEYWGVEQDERSAKEASKNLTQVLIGDYTSVCDKIPEDYFDLIICNDVIEHIEHHDLFLRHLKSKLTNLGVLVLSIPNVRFLPNLFELIVRKDWRYKEAGVLDKTHLRFFTRKSLLRTLEDAGWRIEDIRGINRYGNRAWGPKRIVSYLGQITLGRDTAYLQFAVRARKSTINAPAKNA